MRNAVESMLLSARTAAALCTETTGTGAMKKSLPASVSPLTSKESFRIQAFKVLTAYSTQAKGPIERQGGMFQDRLIAEMVLEKITEADIAVITLACFPENTSQAIGSCSGVTLKLIRLFWGPKMLRSTAPVSPEYRDNRPRWHGVRSGV